METYYIGNYMGHDRQYNIYFLCPMNLFWLNVAFMRIMIFKKKNNTDLQHSQFWVPKFSDDDIVFVCLHFFLIIALSIYNPSINI